MLDYMVTSKARRRLLRLLFAEQAAGSMDELAGLARVGFASAWRELHKMRALGLVESKNVDGVERFVANEAHPLAPAVRLLASAPFAPPADRSDNHARNALFTLGAPTFGKEVSVEDVNYALVQGVALAHRDGTVASVLPVVLWKQRDRLSPERLLLYSRQMGEKRALGFFLDLTAELSGDQRFSEWARPLKDHRWSGVTYLFVDDTRSTLAREVAERNTPPVARRWNLRANTSFETFKSTFDKHVSA